jgi:D-alanyl-D-alanine carboxypeptidase (penicillin-binding protein 5/6)
VSVRTRTLAALAGATFALGAAGGPAPATAAGPALSAPAAILVQPDTGDVAYRRSASSRRQIASTTKLMTVLLLLERRRLSDRITAVPYAALPAESVAGLRAGERLTAADMARALLLASANDAAAAVAVNVGGSQRGFVRLMNQRARRAGLRNTSFANPVGLDDPRNYSTATDLAKLALLVRANPFARRVMDRPSATLRSGARVRVIANRNTLIGAVPWMDGMKTGHTRTAGYLLVGSARRGGVPLVSVVMGTPSEAARNADTLALMGWGFARYRRSTPVRAGREVASVPVRFTDGAVPLAATRTLRVVARRGERLRTRVVGLPREVTGPVERGTRLGRIQVLRRGRVVAQAPLATTEPVERASLVARLGGWGGPLGVVLLLAVAAAVAAGSLLRARRRRSPGRSRTRSETA